MVNWIDGKRKHILIWALLLIYLVSANRLYIQYILQNGKPGRTNVPLPAQTSGVNFTITAMQPVQIDGQNLYQLKGYAFIAANPLQKNKISVVLSSPARNYVFPTEPARQPTMIQSYKGYRKGMESAEFIMLLSEKTLEPGQYQISLLLEHPSSKSRAFVTTGSTIKRTPNTFHFSEGK